LRSVVSIRCQCADGKVEEGGTAQHSSGPACRTACKVSPGTSLARCMTISYRSVITAHPEMLLKHALKLWVAHSPNPLQRYTVLKLLLLPPLHGCAGLTACTTQPAGSINTAQPAPNLVRAERAQLSSTK
jgi:hypothetical protein